jgi:hypothetical protein
MASGAVFDSTEVRTHAGAAADIHVDLPADLWTYIVARNEQSGLDLMQPGTYCTAEVDVPGYERELQDNDTQTRGVVDQPSPAAIQGAGYQLSLASSACAPVPFTEAPDAYVGHDRGSEQDSALRGFISVCSGCLRGMACDELVP